MVKKFGDAAESETPCNGDTFSNTVQKARIFAAAIEGPKARKSVRITTPPAQEALQMIEDDSSLHKRTDKLEDMIRSLQDPSVNV